MNNWTWQKALSGLLIISVLWLAAIWAEHQLEHLNPSHSEQDCHLCLQLHKLSSAVSSSLSLLVALVTLSLLPLAAGAYQYQAPQRAKARAPPSWC